MIRPALFTVAVALLLSSTPLRADWPQWRGADRNGIAHDTDLPEVFPDDYSLTKVWETEEGIPSDKYGGHGSVSVADGKVYLSIVWHRDEPTETRSINSDVLSTLGYRSTRIIPKETVEAMEHERMNLSRRLRGAALEEWAKQWVEDNLDPKTQLSLGGWIVSRFQKGKGAISLADFDTLLTVAKKTFANQAEMEAWVAEQGFDAAVQEQIIKAVPATVKVADDVILCLDANTGEEIWRFSSEGSPSGRTSSSTPAVVGGKVYAALSEHFYCVDAEKGTEIWKTPLTGKKGPASSPLVANGKVYLQQNLLTAFDAENGSEIWQNKEVKGAHSSPAIWNAVILCNSQKELFGVDAETGETLWTVPGGGDGTPVVHGDKVVICSKTEGKNLIAYSLSEGGAEELWSHAFLARRYGSTPVIQNDHVYHMGSERHLCVRLSDGEKLWEREAQSSISSPALADNKLLVYENRGGFIAVIDSLPEDYNPLGRAKVGALYCASPALSGNTLYLRTAKTVAAYRFE